LLPFWKAALQKNGRKAEINFSGLANFSKVLNFGKGLKYNLMVLLLFHGFGGYHHDFVAALGADVGLAAGVAKAVAARAIQKLLVPGCLAMGAGDFIGWFIHGKAV